MGVFSILQPGRPRMYTGPIADLMQDGRIWGVNEFITPSDGPPGVLFRGNGVDKFLGLFQIGQSVRPMALTVSSTAAGTSAVILDGIRKGLITSTNTGAQTITMPTDAVLRASIKPTFCMQLEFTVENTGTGIITVAVATGVTVAPAIVTGSDTLTVAVGSIGIFRLIFKSAGGTLLSRVQ